MAIKKNENPNKKIGISEAEYARARRDRKRLQRIKEAIKPINQIVKNIE